MPGIILYIPLSRNTLEYLMHPYLGVFARFELTCLFSFLLFIYLDFYFSIPWPERPCLGGFQNDKTYNIRSVQERLYNHSLRRQKPALKGLFLKVSKRTAKLRLSGLPWKGNSTAWVSATEKSFTRFPSIWPA